VGKLIVWMWHEAMYSAEKTGCYGADGVGKAEVMSEADVRRTIESFNVPGLRRNHDNGEGDWRVVKGEQYGGSGWVLREGDFLVVWKMEFLMADEGDLEKTCG